MRLGGAMMFRSSTLFSLLGKQCACRIVVLTSCQMVVLRRPDQAAALGVAGQEPTGESPYLSTESG